MTTLYFITAALWGIYSAQKNIILYDEDAKPLVAFMLNTIFCPVAIILAIMQSDF